MSWGSDPKNRSWLSKLADRKVAAEPPPAAVRRRFGGVVHDHRGTGTLLWSEEPTGPTAAQRLPLTVAGEAGASPRERGRKPTDLRKLSEWIKLQRELELRRERGED
jgi:hypothetical protein